MAGRDFMEQARQRAFTEGATARLLLASFDALERISEVYERERSRLPECIRDIEPPQTEETPAVEPESPATVAEALAGAVIRRVWIDGCRGCGGWGFQEDGTLCRRCGGRGKA